MIVLDSSIITVIIHIFVIIIIVVITMVAFSFFLQNGPSDSSPAVLSLKCDQVQFDRIS